MKIEIELPPGYTCKTTTSGGVLKIQIVPEKEERKEGFEINKTEMRILKGKGLSKKKNNKTMASSSKGTTSTGPKKTYVKS